MSRRRQQGDLRRAGAKARAKAAPSLPAVLIAALPPAPEGRAAYIAVIAVESFGGAVMDFDLRALPKTVRILARHIGAGLQDAVLGRVASSTLEVRFLADGDAQADAELRTLAATLEAAIAAGDGAIPLKVVIGHAPWSPGAALSRVMANAEYALSKARGVHLTVACFTDRDRSEAEGRLALLHDLAKALAAGELALHYQPKLNLRSGRIESAEALMRWRHPVRGSVPPDVFIDLAERSGQIEALTRFALERAIAEQAALREAGHPVAIHVNISGQLIADEPFVDWAIATVAAAEGRIGFEITETAVIGDPERGLRHLRRIADAGIDIAIDDYGVGLSSLVYLKQFPAKVLKIDKSFISGLTASHRDPLIVRSTIDLAHALEMEITAEGVEDAMTQALLQVMGCDQIQGYHLAKPMPIGDLAAFLTQYAEAPVVKNPLPLFARAHAN